MSLRKTKMKDISNKEGVENIYIGPNMYCSVYYLQSKYM